MRNQCQQFGPAHYRQFTGSIGVQESLNSPMPIGMATQMGWTNGGLAV